MKKFTKRKKIVSETILPKAIAPVCFDEHCIRKPFEREGGRFEEDWGRKDEDDDCF